MKRKKVNWTGHILHRNWILQNVIEGKKEGRLEVMGRRRRRLKQLVDDVKEKRGHWILKEKAVDRTLRRTRFGWMNEL
jgi:hypothetical protein